MFAFPITLASFLFAELIMERKRKSFFVKWNILSLMLGYCKGV